MIVTKRGTEVSAKDAARAIFFACGAYHKQLMITEITEHSKIDAVKATDDEWSSIEDWLAEIEKAASRFFGLS